MATAAAERARPRVGSPRADRTRGLLAHHFDRGAFALRFAARGIDGGHLRLRPRRSRRGHRGGFARDAQALTFVETIRILAANSSAAAAPRARARAPRSAAANRRGARRRNPQPARSRRWRSPATARRRRPPRRPRRRRADQHARQLLGQLQAPAGAQLRVGRQTIHLREPRWPSCRNAARWPPCVSPLRTRCVRGVTCPAYNSLDGSSRS